MITPFFFRRVWLNPLVIFFAVWFLNFLVYELDNFFHFYYIVLSQRSEFLFVLSFVGFFLGGMSMALYKALPRNKIPSSVLPQKEYSYLAFMERLSGSLFTLILISVLGKYLLLVLNYGNPLAHLGEIRAATVSGAFVYPKILQFFSIFRYVLILNLGALLVFSAKKKKYMILTTIAFMLSILTDVAVAGRGGILNTFLFLIGVLLTAYLAQGVKLKAKHYFGILLSVLLLFTLFGSILYFRSNETDFFRKFAVSIYLYFTGTIPAVESFVENPWPSSLPGYNTFSGLYQGANKAVGLFGLNFLSPQDYQTFYAPITHMGPFNSAGHLAYYYSDFREFGVLIFPYLLGLWSTWLFFYVYERPKILTIQMCAIATAFIFTTVSGTMTSGASIWFTIIILLAQYVFFEWVKSIMEHKKALKI
ncbi:MAG TPA: O-antigen polymerase [Candidatus Paceibacterota bacterium]|nr:O-antigen polymerase [Candidatus Paceibacterota bacterium]